MLKSSASNTENSDLNIIKSLRIVPEYPSVLERYYKNQILDGDIMISTHSNRISLITLAPNHEILKSNKTIKSIDFSSTKKVNRLDNQVKGKGKKGAQKVSPESILCTIICTDDTTFPIKSCIKGKIIEINKRLVEEPHLLTEKPFTDGYIAIVLPPFQSKSNDY